MGKIIEFPTTPDQDKSYLELGRKFMKDIGSCESEDGSFDLARFLELAKSYSDYELQILSTYDFNKVRDNL